MYKQNCHFSQTQIRAKTVQGLSHLSHRIEVGDDDNWQIRVPFMFSQRSEDTGEDGPLAGLPTLVWIPPARYFRTTDDGDEDDAPHLVHQCQGFRGSKYTRGLSDREWRNSGAGYFG